MHCAARYHAASGGSRAAALLVLVMGAWTVPAGAADAPGAPNPPVAPPAPAAAPAAPPAAPAAAEAAAAAPDSSDLAAKFAAEEKQRSKEFARRNGFRMVEQDGRILFCRENQGVTGSRVQKQRRCVDRQQAELEAKNAKEITDKVGVGFTPQDAASPPAVGPPGGS